ncbi:hypothetical protein ACFL2J_02000 [Candidatus Omnitrophota bacterium]
MIGKERNNSMRLIGNDGWADDSKVAGDKISEAIIKKEGKEIVIDYEDQHKLKTLTLNSDDGIYFRGKSPDCEFTLYKNTEGYFLFGGYSSAEDGKSVWWFKLKPQSKETS